ncbi:MAG: sigma-70 family RNA polymerase sigma factor [Azoarcus sp.]|nr:sigma-70 family RNA polymerase sigma factor [Azoarcus sp.]
MDDAAARFTPLRPRLLRIAYRMLGSMAEAEDVVQDAWLRWAATDREQIREPEGYLVRIVTRLSLDVLKSARVARADYIGPWLPEPVFDPDDDDTSDAMPALMIALERLSPLERAAFLLHDVFGAPFDEVAAAIGRDAAACRQLAHRARAHVRADRPRFEVPRQRAAEIAEAFFTASRSGDHARLQDLLAADAVFHSDGGGKVRAALRPILGCDKVVRLLCGLARKTGHALPPVLWRGTLDGLPAFVTLETGGVLQTTSLAIEGERIAHIYVVRNPDKLARLRGQLGVD